MLTLLQMQAELKKVVIGQDDAINSLTTTVYKWLLKLYGKDYGVQFNSATTLLMLGSTGIGKTYLIRQIAGLLDYPFVEVNAKSISQEGWTGKSFLNLVCEQVYWKGSKPTIVYLDEFDKIVTPHINGDENVHLHIQNGLLKYIEGFEMNDSKHSKEKLDSSKCLFIFSGAFNGLELDTPKGNIGFNQHQTEEEKKTLQEALIDLGMIPELAGRLQNFCKLKDLNKEDYKDIIGNEEFILNKYKVLFNRLAIEFYIDADELIDRAIKKKLGVRGLIQEVEDEITQLMVRFSDRIDLEILDGVSIPKPIINNSK